VQMAASVHTRSHSAYEKWKGIRRCFAEARWWLKQAR
jgi:hypothetical protein